MIHFDFITYLKYAFISFLELWQIPTRRTSKRILFLLGFFTIFPLVQLFNAICFMLDDFLFPEYKNIELKHPIFIVGNPRSGTTFLHRIMARDTKNFFFFHTWELIFPAIIQKKFWAVMGRIDAALGSVLSRTIIKIEAKLFRDFNKMHKIGLFLPEEDDKLNIHIFSSLDLIWFFPFPDLDRLNHFDEELSFRERKRIMTFHKKCLQRQAYFSGSTSCYFLSKNPLFSPKIESLYEYYPDCRIIYLARNPLEVVPSMVSMAHEIWRSSINIGPGFPLQDQVYQTIRYFYNYPLLHLADKPPESYCLLKYDDLTAQPGRTVRLIYEHFHLPLSPEFEKVLRQADNRAGTYTSNHSYSLEQIGLRNDKIISDLHAVFERFHFDTAIPSDLTERSVSPSQSQGVR